MPTGTYIFVKWAVNYEKNDKNGSGVTVIDGNREDIKFTFKIAEIIKSLFS